MMENYLPNDASMQLKNTISEREEKRKQEVLMQLQAAKEQCPPDKEPFSIEAFAQLYDLTNDRGESNVTPQLIQDLEIQYYLKHSMIKTMAEFAKYREELDAHNVG